MRNVCREIGLEFDPWQVELNRAILAKDASGLYAADTVEVSIPRQVGKTWDIGALVFADSIINPGTTTVWTAHRFKVARETFNELKGLALSPALAPHIDPDDIYTAAGNESITFRNGSRIVFAARERGAIRGFTKVRRLILDEGQILTEAAMSDLAPTMNQATNPQIIIMGTPPKPTDPGEVFTRLRGEALGGTAEGVLYVEYAAAPDADLDDRAAWRTANPSYPKRTPTRALLRLRKLLSEDDWRREVLGIWDDISAGAVIDPLVWAALADTDSERPAPVAFAIDVPPDRATASIAVVGDRAGEAVQAELVRSSFERGTSWVPARIVELVQSWSPVAIVLDASGPAGSLVGPIREALVEAGLDPDLVVTTSAREMGQACGMFYDAVTEKKLWHGNDPRLNAALVAARKRPLGDAWAWHRKNSTDISPLVAVTLALFGLRSKQRSPKRPSAAFAF